MRKKNIRTLRMRWTRRSQNCQDSKCGKLVGAHMVLGWVCVSAGVGRGWCTLPFPPARWSLTPLRTDLTDGWDAPHTTNTTTPSTSPGPPCQRPPVWVESREWRSLKGICNPSWGLPVLLVAMLSLLQHCHSRQSPCEPGWTGRLLGPARVLLLPYVWVQRFTFSPVAISLYA